MRSIGRRCKACERLSRAVLIARALLPVCIILRGCIELRDRSCRALCNRQGGAERALGGQRAAGERPPRARPWRRGSPGPIPNPEVKPAIAESTAASGCGRVGRRARGGRFSLFRAAHRARPTSRRVPRGALFSFSGTEARCHPHRRTAIFGGRAAGRQSFRREPWGIGAARTARRPGAARRRGRIDSRRRKKCSNERV